MTDIKRLQALNEGLYRVLRASNGILPDRDRDHLRRLAAVTDKLVDDCPMAQPAPAPAQVAAE